MQAKWQLRVSGCEFLCGPAVNRWLHPRKLECRRSGDQIKLAMLLRIWTQCCCWVIDRIYENRIYNPGGIAGAGLAQSFCSPWEQQLSKFKSHNKLKEVLQRYKTSWAILRPHVSIFKMSPVENMEKIAVVSDPAGGHVSETFSRTGARKQHWHTHSCAHKHILN